YTAAHDAGRDKETLEKESPRIAELPFDSERKSMTTFHHLPKSNRVIAFTKGAPERVIERCTMSLGANGLAPLDASSLIEQAERMASGGLRVLAIARREWPAVPGELTPANIEDQLTFVGFVGLFAPPRREVERAVAQCREAGMTAVMITGDHPLTAHAIAVRLGISDESDDRLITGRELGQLDDQELAARVADLRVYARVNPEQKIR